MDLCQKNQQQNKQKYEIRLNQKKIIRQVCLLGTDNKLAILTQSDVTIYSIDEDATIGVLKKLSYPRAMMVIPKKQLLLIQYSDNLTYIFNWQTCEKVYSILGMSSNTKKIQCSQNGCQLVYGDHQSLQMFDINKGQLSMFVNSIGSVNCYGVNKIGDEVCCGSYAGHIIVIKSEKKQNHSLKIPKIHYVNNFNRSVMGVCFYKQKFILGVTMDAQICIIHSTDDNISVLTTCKIQNQLTTMKMINITSKQDKIWIKINQNYYRTNSKTYLNIFNTKQLCFDQFQKVSFQKQLDVKDQPIHLIKQQNSNILMLGTWNKNVLKLAYLNE